MARLAGLFATLLALAAAGCLAPPPQPQVPLPDQIPVAVTWSNNGTVPIVARIEVSPGAERPFEEREAFLRAGESVAWHVQATPGTVAIRASFHLGEDAATAWGYSMKAPCNGPLDVTASGGLESSGVGGLEVPATGSAISLAYACNEPVVR